MIKVFIPINMVNILIRPSLMTMYLILLLKVNLACYQITGVNLEPIITKIDIMGVLTLLIWKKNIQIYPLIIKLDMLYS